MVVESNAVFLAIGLCDDSDHSAVLWRHPLYLGMIHSMCFSSSLISILRCGGFGLGARYAIVPR